MKRYLTFDPVITKVKKVLQSMILLLYDVLLNPLNIAIDTLLRR